MNHSDIELMAQGLPPSRIGKDHEEVVIWLATQLLDVQQKLGVAIMRGDACMQAEIVWEKAMMAAIGEDGVGCVVKAIAALKAERDALAVENAALLDFDIDEFRESGPYQHDDLILNSLNTPATDAYLNAIRAEGITMFASTVLAAAGNLDSTITMERLMLDAEEFYEQLRASAGKDGE